MGVVIIIDDDVSIRKSLRRLISSAGYEVQSYASAEEFLQSESQVEAGCIIVDLHMPGASGIDLQDEIKKRKRRLPIIFVSGGGDTASGVHAMKQGAVDFLTKPIDESRLLEVIARATKDSYATFKQDIRQAAAQEMIAKLTPRELEIMSLVVNGMRNKQIAGLLGISESTVKVHRGRVMRKVEARTVADLINFAETACTNSPATH